jgi:hypothetical protein
LGKTLFEDSVVSAADFRLTFLFSSLLLILIIMTFISLHKYYGELETHYKIEPIIQEVYYEKNGVLEKDTIYKYKRFFL